MPDVIYHVASSLDGYIATADGGMDWLAPFQAAQEDYGFASFLALTEAVLMGSRTYEQSAGFDEWPFKGKPCWVFSERHLQARQPEVSVTARTPEALVEELGDRGVGSAWLVGGGTLAGSFSEAGLITEYVVSLIPVILGGGVPLLGPGGVRHVLKLADTRPYPSGIVQLRYVRG